MITEKDKAEAYVRSQIPELMELSFGCEVRDKYSKVKYIATDKPHQMYGFPIWDFVPLQGFENAQNTLSYEIIGHPIQPHHWLKCLVEATKDNHWMLNARGEMVNMKNFGNRHFKNEYLIIGTERFYKAFNSIVRISNSNN